MLKNNFLWNPEDMQEAYSFYRKKHTKYLQEFINRIFTKNSYKMRIRSLAVTKRLIESMSNVYKSSVKREFKGDISDSVASSVKNCLVKTEELLNLFSVSAIYSYLDKDNKLKIKAMPAHRFSVVMEGENVKELIIKVTEKRDSNNERIGVWNWYKEGNIYQSESKRFEELAIGKPIGVYKEIPLFIIFSDPDEPEARISEFVEIEKDMVANLSLNRLSSAIALLKLLVAPNATDEDVNYISDIVGNMTGIIGLPNTVQGLQSLDMGNIDNNINFNKLNKEELRMIAVQNGADYTALDVDENIESGKAKELKLSYMQSVRAGKVPEWEEMEYSFWSWLQQQEPSEYKELSYIDFGTLDISLSAIEKIELKEKEAVLDYNQVERGIYQIKDYVKKYNGGYTEQELKQIEEDVRTRLI